MEAGDFLCGFLFAMTFAWVKRYFLRLALSLVAPLSLYWLAMWLISQTEYRWYGGHFAGFVLGALWNAHLPLFWSALLGLVGKFRASLFGLRGFGPRFSGLRERPVRRSRRAVKRSLSNGRPIPAASGFEAHQGVKRIVGRGLLLLRPG